MVQPSNRQVIIHVFSIHLPDPAHPKFLPMKLIRFVSLHCQTKHTIQFSFPHISMCLSHTRKPAKITKVVIRRLTIRHISHLCSWSHLPNMTSSRSPSAAIYLKREDYDCLLVVGDRTINLEHCRTVERLARLSNKCPWWWSPLAPMLFERNNTCGIIELENDRVLVAGGGSKSTEIFKVPAIDTDDLGQWTQMASLTRTLAATYLINLDGVLIAFGMCYSLPGKEK